MAILKGFPPSNTISPSVRITEKDLSFIAPEQSFHRAGLVGFASKGPINIPTVVSSRRQLNRIFGYPHPESGDPYLIYAAEQYLLVANELYIVRVADTDEVSWESAKTAKLEIESAGGQVYMETTTAGPYNFSDAGYFKWRLNGVLASKTLVVLKDTDHPDPLVNEGGYSTEQLVEELNSQLISDIDGIEFYATDDVSPKLGVRTTFSFGPDATLELVSVQDSIYGPNSVTGLGSSMTSADYTGNVTENFDFSTVDSRTIQVVVD